MKNVEHIGELRQDYAAYHAADHRVWQILYERQMKKLPGKASEAFLKGLDLAGFQNSCIPDFQELNKKLRKLTGWSLTGVPGIVDNRSFFELLAERKFPATTWLRSMEQLDYLEEPDMFHDVFAHVPLLTDPAFCDFLEGLSSIGLRHIEDARSIELLSRVYWYTVEFGLIREKGELKIYGAGILSSNGESDYCLDADLPRHRYDVRQILKTPYIKEKYQEEYFVIDSYRELDRSLPLISDELAKRANVQSTAR